MKLFFKIFIIVFLIDIALGFSIAYFIGNTKPSLFVHFVDEIISFPTSTWNRLFPDYGIYRRSSNLFWSIIILNAFVQALIIYSLRGIIKNMTKTA